MRTEHTSERPSTRQHLVAAALAATAILALSGARIATAQAQPTEPQQLVPPERRADSGTVLIVKSGALAQYEKPIEAFSQAIERPVRVLELDSERGDAQALLREAAARLKPVALFALGAPAAHAGRSALPSLPLTFAMVVNWERYGLDRGPVSGVTVELPVAALFTRFKLILPQVNIIGVIHSPATDPARIERARQAAASLGITLVEEAVAYPDEVAGAYRRMRTEIDALWMVPDSTVVSLRNFEYLSSRTRRDQVAFLAFSENFVRAGALMSIAPNYETMGSQAAVLLERLIENPASPPPVQAPMGSTLVVNEAVAQRMSMKMDKATVSMADVIIGSEGGTP